MSISSKPSIPTGLAELLDEFALLDRDMKSELLIELAERFVPVPSSIACVPYPDEFKVPSCESDAYVFYQRNPDKTLQFHFAVLNPQGISAKAFAQILQENLSGQALEQVCSVSDEIVFEVFGSGISMGKGLGLRSMIQLLKALSNRERL